MSKGKSQSLVLKVVVTESRTSKKAIKCGGRQKAEDEGWQGVCAGVDVSPRCGVHMQGVAA